MKNRPIDELCELMGVNNTNEFTKEFGISNGTLSNLNCRKGSRIVHFLLDLSIESLRRSSKNKRKEISREMRKKS
jgi:hypothetical protein